MTPPFALLVGGGHVSLPALRQLAPQALCIVAADGGANVLQRHNIAPHYWAGDGDSLSVAAQHFCTQHNTHCQPSACQDTTDMQKALNVLPVHANTLVVGLGFGGSRFDHTLAALHVLHQYAPKPIILHMGADAVALLPEYVTLLLPKHTRVSLFPLHPVTGVDSQGLQYPIAGLNFALGKQIGTSNSTTATHCTITLSAAFAMAAIVPWRHWQALAAAIC